MSKRPGRLDATGDVGTRVDSVVMVDGKNIEDQGAFVVCNVFGLLSMLSWFLCLLGREQLRCDPAFF